MTVVEKKKKPGPDEIKMSFAFYLSRGLVDEIARLSKETGRSKSEVLELLARAGLDLHKKPKK